MRMMTHPHTSSFYINAFLPNALMFFILIGGYFISASIQPRNDTNEAFQLMAISLLA